MKVKKSLTNYYKVLFVIFAIAIIIGVLFITPQVGVADQGDFDRIMSISGLSLLDSDANNPHFIRFMSYIVTNYQITNIEHVTQTLFGSSLGYIIILINTICKLFGQTIFKTQYLAIVYSIIYILAFSIILKCLNIKNRIKFIILGLLILLIFFDGNYLIWFNSLYGEPMMFTSLVLFIASVLNYIYYKYTLKGNEKIFSKILFILFATFLFIGSKLQVLTSLPIIILFIIKILFDNRRSLNKLNLSILCVIFCILIAYPLGISHYSNELNADTQYNSVFYGVLKDSKTPKQDLIALGLNPDMAVDAGKNAYLDKDKYVKYSPKSELTAKEFYGNISNLKLAKFYLLHPQRLLNGMEYTAHKAFSTSTTLGKCYRSYSEKPIINFDRFTLWSSFRENILPHRLYFIVSIYLILAFYSLYKYIKNKSNLEIKTKLLLLWTIMLIGAIQFPMPFVGNGHADTAKQLFLFNFIFDGLLLSVFTYIIFKILDLLKIK
jgi:hypothetical protein